MHELNNIIPETQFEKIFSETDDLDKDFLGFTEQYRVLSKIIPEDTIIIDFGCGYGAQCFYFLNHKKYIGIDNNIKNHFESSNSEFYNMRIQDFLISQLYKFKNEKIFGICNYVDDFIAIQMVKEKVKNCFIYYPGV